ncbi:MAG: IMS domain-containing protein [Phormidesmis sp. CAN_BIN36]|nr:IMS domain-containing protein [Phormidesmis sp. CAN_BIN36]
MRIPLDYYRILGLPIQATADQLKQAHRDRALQLPRREYSEAAIAARRQLLDEAYSVLSKPEQRQSYDASFLAGSYDADRGQIELGQPDEMAHPDARSPSIEIQDRQLIGALLVLQELGEYELVLRSGRPYLSSGNANLRDGRFGDARIVLSDIVLTVALSCLELGREQWQQGQYENAAEALETGQELLLKEGLFASVRGEIQSDLYKLRPYRILELLALPDQDSIERLNGLRLLQDMLQERSGIDGSGNDQSGLSIDDFLRFIQQLRGYLTAEEQQTLFEEEARRPSAVATYLAVYALMARGFAEQQPALVRRAKLMLVRLGSRQDVHLEQAVCALLLGQTEAASRALELSQEYEPLVFIRENSQGAPDLLPGLCLYAERWLQDEVFPHFRDLSKQRVSLKDYFANAQVQEYLEELPAESESAEWSAQQHWNRRKAAAQTIAPSEIADSNGRTVRSTQVHEISADRPSRAATLSAGATVASSVVTKPSVEQIANLSPEGSLGSSDQRPRSGDDRQHRNLDNGYRVPDADDLPPRRSEQPAKVKRRRGLPLPLILLGIFAVGAVGFLLFRSIKFFTPKPTDDQLLVQLDQPVISIPDQTATPLSGEMNQALAQQVLEFWLDAKKDAMGQSHAVEKLTQVLAEPKLAEWRKNAEEAKRENWYKQYEHTVKVDAVKVSSTSPGQATADAAIAEVTKYYEGEQLADTKTDNLQVRYSLVLQDNQWRIKDWQVL